MKALMQGSRDFTSMMQNGGGADDRIVQRLNLPAGFPVVPQYTLTRINGAVSTLFDITSKIPPVSNIWYVDPTSGNDGTAVVNDRSKPLLNLATALAKVDVDQVRIINLTSDFLARTTKSWNNVQPTRSVSVIVEGRFVTCRSRPRLRRCRRGPSTARSATSTARSSCRPARPA